MYDKEKIKKMKNHELAMEAYYYSINNELIGGISEKNAVKCFEQIIAMLDSDERLNLPFITVNGKCGSLTLTNGQNSQMSFRYGFFYVKFLFFTVVCVVYLCYNKLKGWIPYETLL